MVAGRRSGHPQAGKLNDEAPSSSSVRKLPCEFDVPLPRPITVVNKPNTPSGKQSASSASRKRKQPEDDEVFVPIETTRRGKRIRLTDRQREQFLERKERGTFAEESLSQSDSVPLIARLPSEYLIDSQSSQTLFPSAKKPNDDDAATDFCAFAVPELPTKKSTNGESERSIGSFGKENDPEVVKSSQTDSVNSLNHLHLEDSLSRQNSHQGDIWLDESDDSDNESLSSVKKKIYFERCLSAGEAQLFQKALNGNEERIVGNVHNASGNDEVAETSRLAPEKNNTSVAAVDINEEASAVNISTISRISSDESESLSERPESLKSPVVSKKKPKTASAKDDGSLSGTPKKTPRKGEVRSRDIRSYLSPKSAPTKSDKVQDVAEEGEVAPQKVSCLDKEEELHDTTAKGANVVEELGEKPTVSDRNKEDGVSNLSNEGRVVSTSNAKKRRSAVKKRRTEKEKDADSKSNEEITRMAESIEVDSDIAEGPADNEQTVLTADQQKEEMSRLTDSIESVDESPVVQCNGCSENDASSTDLVIEDVLEPRLSGESDMGQVNETASSLSNAENNDQEESSVGILEKVIVTEETGKKGNKPEICLDEAHESNPEELEKLKNALAVDNMLLSKPGSQEESRTLEENFVTPNKLVTLESSLCVSEKRTPGILKRGSPASSIKPGSEGSSQKPKRVHFEAATEDHLDDVRSQKSRFSASPNPSNKRRSRSALFQDPKDTDTTVKADQPVVPLLSLQEEDLKSTEEPLLPELVNSRDLLTPKLLTKLAPYGAQALRMALKSRGIKCIGDLARLVEADLTTLPLKPPKAANLREVLCDYAKIPLTSAKHRGEKKKCSEFLECEEMKSSENEEAASFSRQQIASIEPEHALGEEPDLGKKDLNNAPRNETRETPDEDLEDTQPLFTDNALSSASGPSSSSINADPCQEQGRSTPCNEKEDEVRNDYLVAGLSFDKILEDVEKMEAFEAKEKEALEMSGAEYVPNSSCAGDSTKLSDSTSLTPVPGEMVVQTVTDNENPDGGALLQNDGAEKCDYKPLDLSALFPAQVLGRLQSACAVLESCEGGQDVPRERKLEARLALCDVIEVCTKRMRFLDG